MNTTLPTATEVDTLLAAHGLQVLRPTVKDIAARLLATTALNEVPADRVAATGATLQEFAVIVDYGQGKRAWEDRSTVRAAQAYLNGDIVRRIA